MDLTLYIKIFLFLIKYLTFEVSIHHRIQKSYDNNKKCFSSTKSALE